MRKLALIVLGLLSTILLPAQETGVKGKVLSKVGRYPVENARVRLYKDARSVAETQSDKKGAFRLTGVEAGEYVLLIQSPEYLENRVSVTVTAGRIKDVFNVMLQSVPHAAAVQPEAAHGSSDVVNNLASASFPLQRSVRGEQRDYYLAGVHLDQRTLWQTGLSEALRANKTVDGAAMDDVFGGLYGTSSLDGTAGSLRSGFRSNLSTNNALYHFRGQASYSTGDKLGDGWVISADASYHTPALSRLVRGNAVSAYVGVDKQLDSSNRLSVAYLHTHAPIAFLKYTYAPSQRISAYFTALGQFGKGDERLHAAGGFQSKIGERWTLSAAADIQVALSGNAGHRAETWFAGRYQTGRWSLRAALQGRYQRLQGANHFTWQGKTEVQYQMKNSKAWMSAGLFQLPAEQKPRWSTDLNWSYSSNGINVRATGYLLSKQGQVKPGAELGFRTPIFLIPNVSLQGVALVGPVRRYSGGASWNKGAASVSADVQYFLKALSLNFQGGYSWKLPQGVLGFSSGLKVRLNNVETRFHLPRWNYLLNLYYRI
mgnify:FL=1